MAGFTQSYTNNVLKNPAFLLIIIALFATVIGFSASLYPNFLAATIVVLLISVFLINQFEFSLALLTVGFFVYPLIMNWVGIDTSSNATLAFYTILSVTSFIGILIKRKNKFAVTLTSPITITTFLLVFWMIGSWVTMGFNNEFALIKIGYIPFLMLTPLIVIQLYSKENIQRFFWFCIATSLVGVILLFRNVLQTDITSILRPTPSEGASALGFAYGVGFSAIMGLGLLRQKSVTSRQRLTIFSIIITGVLTAILTGSRGPLIAILVSSLFLLLADRFNLKTVLTLGLGLLLSSIIISQLFTMLPTVVIMRYASIIEANNMQELSDLFTNSRGSIWEVAYHLWLTNPIVGVGIGNFGIATKDTVSFAHHFLLEALTELGLIGFSILSILMIWLLLNTVRLLRLSDPLGVLIVALLIYSIVQMSFSGQLQASVGFWITCGLYANHNLTQQTCRATNTGIDMSEPRALSKNKLGDFACKLPKS